MLAESGNGLLGFTCPRAGTYALGIRDRDYRGDAAMSYRLHVGDMPIVTGRLPAAACSAARNGHHCSWTASTWRRPHSARQGAGRRCAGHAACR